MTEESPSNSDEEAHTEALECYALLEYARKTFSSNLGKYEISFSGGTANRDLLERLGFYADHIAYHMRILWVLFHYILKITSTKYSSVRGSKGLGSGCMPAHQYL